ncbi:MAG TPA: DUF2127 domain-containing protein [Polyangiaceae bacterium]
MRRERGLAIIIAYKLVKGGLWLVLAVVVVVLMNAGLGEGLLGLAVHLRHHSNAWALELADLLVRAATRRGLWTLVVALLADGTLTLAEGWALWRGFWWAPWVVVVATSSLLPFEIAAIARHPQVSRFVLLAVNLLIVGYLGRKALRERRERASHAGDAGR